MRRFITARRTYAIVGAALALAIVASGAFLLTRGAKAAAPYNSHPITVSPQYVHESGPSAAIFSC